MICPAVGSGQNEIEICIVWNDIVFEMILMTVADN